MKNLDTRIFYAFWMIFISLLGIFVIPDIFISAICIAALYELNMNFQKRIWYVFLIYSLIIVMGVISFWIVLNAFDTKYLLFLIITVCCTDTFAYLIGSKIGGVKLCERISPSKTVSGLIGGICGGICFGYFAINLLNINHEIGRIGLIVIVLLAILGDLLESYIKRLVGVKDFNNFIPGHGGLLDRLDSFLPTIIAALLILEIK